MTPPQEPRRKLVCGLCGLATDDDREYQDHLHRLNQETRKWEVVPQEPRAGGVRLNRFDHHGWEWYEPGEIDAEGDEPGTWFPLAEAESLIDPNDRDNEWCEAITAEIPWEVDGDGDPMSSVADAVQSLRMQRDERIDPNDPAVRERAIQALAEDIDDRWSLHADDLEAVAHEMASVVLAALRSKP